MRWGLGPVFIYDCLANSRRWQTYAIRSSGVAALLLAMTTIAMSNIPTVKRNSWREYAQLGEYYFYAMIGVELALVMLAAPAAAASAICLDRARGTLAHMLATDLSDPEIVLGKLSARLMPVLGLVACSWPVLSISSLLGGIDPTALTLAFAIVLAIGLLGCTTALALSVWATKPHEVVLVTYTVWILVLLIWPIWYVSSVGGFIGPPPPWTLVANPYYLAFAPYTVPGQFEFWDYLGFFAVTIGFSGAFTVLAVWRMRPVACRGTRDNRNEPGLGRLGRLVRWLPGPRLDNNPVLWREWHRSRPSPWMMGLVVLLGGTTFLACLNGAVWAWAIGIDSDSPQVAIEVGIMGFVLQVLFGLLMLSAVAPMSMSEERQRGSLDILATTTLSSRAIVLGKWLGTYRLVGLLTIVPSLMALALVTAHKDPPKVIPGISPIYYVELARWEQFFGVVLLVATILAHGALINSVGLALATWIKRQSRAIAISVGFFVVVAIGWPFLVEFSRTRTDNRALVALSPIVSTGELAYLLANRTLQYRGPLLWIAFWDVVVSGLAIGVLWLTVRTFDLCFGRVSEQPRRTPLLSDFTLVLAGMVAVGGLSGAIAIWTSGVKSPDLGFEMNAGVILSALLVTIGFLMVCALATISISESRSRNVLPVEADGLVPARRFVLNRWWESFRLVLLLAIGLALIALAMATTFKNVLSVPVTMQLPTGVAVTTSKDYTGTIIVTTIEPGGKPVDRQASAEEVAALYAPGPGEPGLVERLYAAVLVVLTVVAHGAAATSVGLAPGIWIRRRTRAIATSVGVMLLLAMAWPICVYLVLGHDAWGLACLSPVLAFSLPLSHIGLHSDLLSVVVGPVLIWDVVLLLAALGLMWMSIRAVDRGLSYRGKPSARRVAPGPDELFRDNSSPRASNDVIEALSRDETG